MAREIRPGGTIERRMGCHNCIHSSHDNAKKFWEDKRQKDLQQALDQALTDPMKEDAPQVKRIKHMVNEVDNAVAAGLLIRCRVGGSEADLISIAFLCDKWTAATGASEARDGAPVDKLPGEVMEEVQSGQLSKELKNRKIQ